MVQAEAERSCRPASCSASEQTANAPGVSKQLCKGGGGLSPSGSTMLPAPRAAGDGGNAGGDMDCHPHGWAEHILPCVWALGLWLPLETCFILLFSQNNLFCGFLELSQGAGKLQMFFITGQVFMGCSGAGSICVSGLKLQLGN